MPRGRPKGSKSKGKVGRPRKNSDNSDKNKTRGLGKKARKSSNSSPPKSRSTLLVKQGKLTAAQVGPLISKVSAVCDSVLSSEKSNGGSKFKSAIRVFTNELRRQFLSLGDEYMGSTESERKFLQLSRDRAALQKSLLSVSKHVNDTRWDLRRTNQQQKAMVDGQAELQELQSVLRDLSGLKDAPSRAETPIQDTELDTVQVGLCNHVNTFSTLEAVASLSGGHERLKSANNQLASLLAVLPQPRATQADEAVPDSLGTEV